MTRQWTTCIVCNRVLWVEDGPVCQDCRKIEVPPARYVAVEEDNAEKVPKKDAQARKGKLG